MRAPAIIAAVLVAAGVAAGQGTFREELSLGKFYEYSHTLNTSYPDERAIADFTSGTLLTNEARGSASAMAGTWIGWTYSAQPKTITIDLGKVYPIEEVRVGMCTRTSYGIAFPQVLIIETNIDKTSAWQTLADNFTIPADNANYVTHDFTTTATAQARYIRVQFTAAATRQTFIDEIRVFGQYTDTRKHVPAAGCMHGSYPIGADGYPYMNIASFESIAKKSIRMVLWYANWAQDFEVSTGYLYDRVIGGRQLEIGWLPYSTTAEQIAKGSHDAFMKKWLADCATRNAPIWLRPMNEFNGSWTFANSTQGSLRYGGNPLEFSRAWRRMYNIAERVGATGNNQIFVWSPNMPSYPGTADNHWTQYYPGNAYVDWVGTSGYNNGTEPKPLLQEWYNTYSPRKPLMIAEGGSANTYPQTPKAKWIADLYALLQNEFTAIKSMVWFHPQTNADSRDLRIDSSPDALAAYQAAIAPAYFLNFNAGISDWSEQ